MSIATTRIISMHLNKGKTIEQCLHDRTAYAVNPDKTENMEFISSFSCDPKTVDGEFLLSKRQYRALTGRTQTNDVIAYQVRQSFKPGEITPEEANRVGYEFASRFLKGKFAFVVATHTDKAHIHNHIIWNSTSLDCKHKYRDFLRSAAAVRHLSDQICTEHQLSVIADPQRHGKAYNVWLGSQPKVTHRDQIRKAIDAALERKPASLDELFFFLREAGCEVKPGKYPSFRVDSSHRFARLDTLGSTYSAENLRAVIAGSRHQPERKPRHSDGGNGFSLLVNIQEKLQDGKGPGYEHWAKSFNLKQMSQTMIYLQEHDLLDYEDLKAKSAAASSRYNQLSDQIRAAEKRMTEISILRTHIINYSKTRDTYIAYRKSGYSKAFLAEHESDILLHKAAKQHFNALGLTKLPSVKSLNGEYTQLLSEKKAAYADYHQAKKEMRELLVVKANVDRILGIEKEHVEEKESPSVLRS